MQNAENPAAAVVEGATDAAPTTPASEPVPAPVRKRPRPGERRLQILQALAAMLEQPGGERVTTAALAARLGVSEAALYRHFASKAQMFEALIDFIEQSIFTLVNQIAERDAPGPAHASRIVTKVLQFAEKNPGLTRVMVGDALVYENDRLQGRMNLFFDKVEAALRQALRDGAINPDSPTPTVDTQVAASVLNALIVGRIHRFARSGFRRMPTDQLDAAIALIV